MRRLDIERSLIDHATRSWEIWELPDGTLVRRKPPQTEEQDTKNDVLREVKAQTDDV